MNILLIHPHEVFSQQEPWTIRIINLAREFSKRKHNVKLLYSAINNQESLRPFFKDGIEFIPFPRKGGTVALIKNCSNFSKFVVWADIVHFQKCFHYSSLPALFNSYIKDKPIHYDWDDWEEKIYYDLARPSIKAAGIFLNILETTLPRMVDTISVSSQRLKDLCIALRIDKHRIFDAPVGADLDVFNPSIDGGQIKRKFNLDGQTVIYLGQLHGAQYVDLFIRAVKILLDRKTQANFMIVGGGSKFQQLKDLSKDLALDDKIIFTGAVKHEEVPEYIAAGDVAVACFQDNEITRCKSPLKLAEYLASGKAIVASNVGEVENMIGGCGILTKAGDVYDLASGIERLLKDKELRLELGKKARRRAEEKYNWSHTADSLLGAYQLALTNH